MVFSGAIEDFDHSLLERLRSTSAAYLKIDASELPAALVGGSVVVNMLTPTTAAAADLVSSLHNGSLDRSTLMAPHTLESANPMHASANGCVPGFTASLDGSRCADIDECKLQNVSCGAAKCHNTHGGFRCGRCEGG